MAVSSSEARAKALQESTLSTTPTDFSNMHERWDVPPIQDSERSHYEKWLQSSGFLAASDPEIWNAICRNWISFLSATSTMPKVVLAPRCKVVTWGPTDSKSLQAQPKRFKRERRVRRRIQGAIWKEFDNLEALAERWPAQVRFIVNQSASGTGVFESWLARVNLGKRRRGNAIWTGLICFLTHAYTEKTLKEMGLEISKDKMESIFSVYETEAWYGHIGQNPDEEGGHVEGAVEQLCKEFITDRQATCTTNPLLWWVGILVQSSLQEGADDYISRGRFNLNILPMDLDIKGRLEGLLHYAKVLVLDHTFYTWETNEVWLREVQLDMAAVSNKWLNAYDDQRPEAVVDNQDCSSVAWKNIVTHLRRQCNKYLGKQQGTAVWQLRLLLEGFSTV